MGVEFGESDQFFFVALGALIDPPDDFQSGFENAIEDFIKQSFLALEIVVDPCVAQSNGFRDIAGRDVLKSLLREQLGGDGADFFFFARCHGTTGMGRGVKLN